MPNFVIKFLFNDLSLVRSHQDALIIFDLIQMLVQVIKYEFTSLNQLHVEQSSQFRLHEFYLNVNNNSAINKLVDLSDENGGSARNENESFLHKTIDLSLKDFLFCNLTTTKSHGWHNVMMKFTGRLPTKKYSLDVALYVHAFSTINQMIKYQTDCLNNMSSSSSSSDKLFTNRKSFCDQMIVANNDEGLSLDKC